MHPSLSLSNLRLLPLSLRKSASAAANGSPDDISKMLHVVNEEPPSIARLTLPIFYANLDLAKAEQIKRDGDVPTLAQRDFFPPVLFALQGLSLSQELPKETFPELWPRVWGWSQLVMRHQHWLARVLSSEEFSSTKTPIVLILLLGRIHRDCKIFAKTIDAEPGVRDMVARVWVFVSRSDIWDPDVQTGAFFVIAHFLQHSIDVSNSEHLDDLIQASGGSLAHFATLLVRFVTHLATEDKSVSLYCMAAALHVMEQTESVRPEVSDLLLRAGIVRALVIMLQKQSNGLTHRDGTLDRGFRVLVAKICDSPGPCQGWFLEALRAGLLDLIVSAMENPRLISADQLKSHIPDLLRWFLPFRSVLVVLSPFLAEVQGRIKFRLVQRSPAWGTWTGFTKTVGKWMQRLHTHESPNRISRRACDNVECEVISVKTDFQCCSGCVSVYYCSVECQRLDWRRGHRKTCAAIRTHSLEHPSSFNSRDESFFRTTLHQAYGLCIPDILLSTLSVMQRAPGKVYLTTFQYRNGEFGVGVDVAEADAPAGLHVFGPKWTDLVSRAAASRGRIHLHVFILPRTPPEKPVGVLLPLRTRTSALHDALLSMLPEH
ncbi:hypothetical protein FB45DRAFT_1012494 [Roridomyces roridus]|uniref:MYND-type domain-containing protein n=1 Tax=Roridomyces roridus TaxID=1738132 RepID=A0AAD7AZW7_9AGAR|nr:hypothetical protein FB45DRAFT_1012494 [Roridomyces roridus]